MSSLAGKVKLKAAESIVSQSLNVLGLSGEKGYRLLAGALGKVAATEQQKMIAGWFCNWVGAGNPGAPWLDRVLRGLHPSVRRRFIAHTVVDVFFRNPRIFARYKAEHGFRPPSIMLVSPTMRCNYRCAGCYAANYTRDDDLPAALFDRVLHEAEEISTKFVTVLGGEPFVYEPLLGIFEKHRDTPFQVFTNGALIDRNMARRLAQLGNVSVVVSVDGFAEETDGRRGKGAFDRALSAMENLKDAGCMLGFSAMVTRNTAEVVTDEKFVDLMIQKGALYGWYFLYMPVGRDPDIRLMPTAEQRNLVRLAGMRFRQEKPILLADFWNDAVLTVGCINGARSYFHINHKGDVEPCIFVHFATHNVKDVSLVEALNSDFFQGLRKMEPFCYNTLRPCPVIDHPKIIRTAIERYGAYPTHPGAESLLSGEIASGLDSYADEVKRLYDPIWEQEYAHWAERWMRLIDFPRERVEARKAAYRLSREKAKSETPIGK